MSIFISGLLCHKTYAQRTIEKEKIGRCVDHRAIRDWLNRPDVIAWNSWDHDGKSWRQREKEFNFRVIGLKPNDYPCVYIKIPSHPDGLLKFSSSDVDGTTSIVRGGTCSADELHYGISKVAERMSSKEVMGPLACRTTAVLMKNTDGAGGVPGQAMQIAKDEYPYPLQLHLHFQYLDPDAAAAFIKKREEEAK